MTTLIPPSITIDTYFWTALIQISVHHKFESVAVSTEPQQPHLQILIDFDTDQWGKILIWNTLYGKILLTSWATLTSERPSLSLSSTYGLSCTRFKSSWSPSRRKASNSWESCCWDPLNRGAYFPIVHWTKHTIVILRLLLSWALNLWALALFLI